MSHYLLTAILIGFFGILYLNLFTTNVSLRDSRNHVNGYVNKEFEQIRIDFGKTLKNERDGLALAVYVKDKLVVDLWGGYADSSTNRSWTKNTLSCTYSTTKIFGSFIIGRMVSHGLLSYEDKVTKYWPEFGQNGKENITVEDMINHKAGLIRFSEPIEFHKANDLDYISKVIEKSKPYWKPGSQVGYHAFTFGFLIDQLVRRIDTKKRIAAEIYNEEILPKINEEFYIGVPLEKFHQVAINTNPTKFDEFWASLTHPLNFLWLLNSYYNGLLEITLNSIPFLRIIGDQIYHNNPDVLAYKTTSSNGVGTARGLAKAALYFFQNENEIFKKNLLKPKSNKLIVDKIVGWELYRSHGLFYHSHPVYPEKFIIIGVGHGGQFIVVDMEDQISIGFIRNGLRNMFLKDVIPEFLLLGDKILKIALKGIN